MRTNPFYDSWLFLIGGTGSHLGVGAWRYLLVAMFWSLAIASIAIAVTNWRGDPAQRSTVHLGTWLFRVLIGAMWFEGALWKLPLPVSGGFVYWVKQLGEHAAFDVHKELVNSVFLPYIQVVNPLVFLAEFGMAVSFLLGFAVRLFAVIGMLFVLHIYFGLYTHGAEWPWQYIFLILVQGFFLIHGAGRSLGLDALLRHAPVGPLKGDGWIARLYRRLS